MDYGNETEVPNKRRKWGSLVLSFLLGTLVPPLIDVVAGAAGPDATRSIQTATGETFLHINSKVAYPSSGFSAALYRGGLNIERMHNDNIDVSPSRLVEIGQAVPWGEMHVELLMSTPVDAESILIRKIDAVVKSYSKDAPNSIIYMPPQSAGAGEPTKREFSLVLKNGDAEMYDKGVIGDSGEIPHDVPVGILGDNFVVSEEVPAVVTISIPPPDAYYDFSLKVEYSVGDKVFEKEITNGDKYFALSGGNGPSPIVFESSGKLIMPEEP